MGLARAAVAAGVALAVAGVAGCGPAGNPALPGPPPISAGQLDRSVTYAFSFLNRLMDTYATGSTPRLVQSFTGGVLGRDHFTASQTYDDAVLIDAYLAAGTAAGRWRAEIIGDALLYVQANDPLRDGRIRAAYAPTPLRSPAAVTIVNAATTAGDLA